MTRSEVLRLNFHPANEKLRKMIFHMFGTLYQDTSAIKKKALILFYWAKELRKS